MDTIFSYIFRFSLFLWQHLLTIWNEKSKNGFYQPTLHNGPSKPYSKPTNKWWLNGWNVFFPRYMRAPNDMQSSPLMLYIENTFPRAGKSRKPKKHGTEKQTPAGIQFWILLLLRTPPLSRVKTWLLRYMLIFQIFSQLINYSERLPWNIGGS